MNDKNKNSPQIGKCPFYDECPIRLHPLSATDNPNMAAHLGFRFFYTLIAWLVLGFKVNEGFFLAMCFFALPVFMDCVKFTPLSKKRKRIILVETIFSGLLFGVSIIGVIGIYQVKKVGETWQIFTKDFIGYLPSGFDISIMWYWLGLIVIITMVDWLCNESKLDMIGWKRRW